MASQSDPGDTAESVEPSETPAFPRAFARAHERLERQLEERTSELARTSLALAAETGERTRAEWEVLDLRRRLANAREDEQRRLARELHDQTGQTLTTLSLAAAAVKRVCTAPAAAKLAEDLTRVVTELELGVREITTRLRPGALDDLGLEAALAQLVTSWSEKNGVEAEYHGAAEVERLSRDVETVLYRVVQEALTNVARHARAKHVQVTLARRPWEAITIIEDDGIGFDAKFTPQGRFGHTGMRERLAPAEGTLSIQSSPGHGTRLVARVPTAPRSHNA